MRQFNTAAPATPAARNKMRIAGGIIIVAVVIDLTATMMLSNGTKSSTVGAMFGAGAVLLLLGIIFLFTNRRAAK